MVRIIGEKLIQNLIPLSTVLHADFDGFKNRELDSGMEARDAASCKYVEKNSGRQVIERHIKNFFAPSAFIC